LIRALIATLLSGSISIFGKDEKLDRKFKKVYREIWAFSTMEMRRHLPNCGWTWMASQVRIFFQWIYWYRDTKSDFCLLPEFVQRRTFGPEFN